MVEHEEEYREFIIQAGVGEHDNVASSPDSYVSYLNGASRLLNQDISPTLIQDEESINNIITRLNGLRAKATLDNYKTALRHYLAFSRER